MCEWQKNFCPRSVETMKYSTLSESQMHMTQSDVCTTDRVINICNVCVFQLF